MTAEELFRAAADISWMEHRFASIFALGRQADQVARLLETEQMLRKKNAALEEAIGSMVAERQQLENEIEKLKGKPAEISDAIATVSAELAPLRAERSDLIERNRRVLAELREMEETMASKRTELAGIESSIKALREKFG
jgi:chromosome segregation ATPase